ncbi:shootin-1-like [Rhea pennata]|uniref:shootin-1-like n=1 Tax=Rhea pennata TaxID=8795 RepID=UPI002E270710
MLRAALDRDQRALKSFKRVSRIVTQDYCEAVQQLELEQELRLHAEAFAHQMLVEKKEANRQSSILLQSGGPNAQLLRALEDMGNLTRMLEEAKREHQLQALEEQLETSPRQEELDLARAALAAAEEEKAQLRQQLQEAQKQLAELEKKVRALEETLPGDPPSRPDPPSPAAPAAPPPPPPPLPPPRPAVPADPLSVIRQRKGLVKGNRAEPAAEDVKARAVQEMMERIKSGVVLRPARGRALPGQGPSAAAGERQSAAVELRAVLPRGLRRRRVPGAAGRLQLGVAAVVR